MEVKDMNKAELLNQLRASGQINDVGDTQNVLWQRAFDLYKQRGNVVDMGCSSCWSKVKEWLENEND